MATLDQESLFSLEVVVDTLMLSDKTICRFPAVAFRLLDFPTLLVYHVEPELGKKIKIKIKADTFYKVPSQLSELQDRHGKFLIKKGKSCLFKVSPNIMQGHLQTTPLYVMVIDTYPEVPKLVASCTVPLDSCFDDVYDDICKLGISVPSAKGEKGDYNLCNLMGREIGNITLGIRILSLGVGLLPHIPESSVAKLQKRGVVSTCTPKDKAKEKDQSSDNIVLYDLETLEKPIQVSIAPEPKDVDDFQGQTETNIFTNVSTQTFKKKRQKATNLLQIASPQVPDETDFIFVANSECPPPLFFNSEMEVPTSRSLLLSYYPMGLPAQQYASEENDSEEESIRDEDRFSDSDTEVDSKKIIKPAKKDFFKKTNNIPKKEPVPQIQGSLNQLPILNALLQEIVCLQGGQQADHVDHSVKKVLHKIRPRSPLSPVRSKSAQETLKDSPRRKHFDFPKESQEQFVSRIASSRHSPPSPSSPARTHKHVCQAGSPQIIPPTKTITKNKGWLQHNHPAVGVPKTKIQPGMTNTQRLRLAKTNPHLLASLERDEQERLKKRRERMEKKWGTHQFMSSTCQSNISTEITRHPFRDTGKKKVPALDLSGISYDLKHHKKPIPTPRHSVEAKDDYGPSIAGRDTKSRNESIPHSSNSEQLSSRIEVHIPSAIDNDDDSDATSVNDSELASPRPAIRGLNKAKVKYSPVFPPHDSLEPSEHNQYSDDFDQQSSATINTAQLRRIIDKYSDDSDEDAKDQTTLEGLSAGDELGLRCIIDKYTDDESSEKSKLSSFHSEAHHYIAENKNPDKKVTIPAMLKPSSSIFSPDTINEYQIAKQPTLSTRQPFTAVSVTEGFSNTQDSTAYLNRSQVSTQISVDSTTSDSQMEKQQPSRTMYPRPSPRTPRTPRNISVRTDSISSYAPSDQENTSPGGDQGDNYSDSFEDYSEDEESEVLVKPKQMSDMQLDPKARLGYTWGY